jgi:spore maturation protein CgeB
MKFFFINFFWEGNFANHIAAAFEKTGVSTHVINIPGFNHWSKRLKLQQFSSVKTYLDTKTLIDSNIKVFEAIKKVKPDLLFSFNSSRLFPETVKKIRDELHCRTVCVVADNPFDSSRNKHFALCLPYFDLILVSEKMWIPNIRRMAPDSQIEFTLGGFSPEIFKPIPYEEISNDDTDIFGCDISFTGSAYGEQAEGNYRAGILGSLSGYSVKIWGDSGWKYREKYYPSLGTAYQGTRLSYDQLLKLFTLSKINLNMPSPQILTAFQPRVFEIAATKGFQIVDYREDLFQCYHEDEIVTFKTIPELKEKINYFLENPMERTKITEKMYSKTVNYHTWEHRIKEYMQIII